MSSFSLLTKADARRVLESHFAQLSSYPEVKEGVFVVQWHGPWTLLSASTSQNDQDITATSDSSFEDAIRRLASQRPYTVLSPLGDADGLFQMLLRQRAGTAQGLFSVKTAPLDFEECRRLVELPSALERIRAHRIGRIEMTRERGGAAYLFETFAQSMLRRVVSLVEGTAAEWNRGSPIGAGVLARAVLETAAVWWKALANADRLLNEGK